MTNQPKNKTQATKASVKEFISDIKDREKRKDTQELNKLMKKITGMPPVMWGPSIIGYDRYHYKYESGREGDMPVAAFSPRSPNLTIYLVGTNKYKKQLAKLGPHKTGKVCLYINRLSEVDMKVLEEIIKDSYKYVMSHKNTMGRAE